MPQGVIGRFELTPLKHAAATGRVADLAAKIVGARYLGDRAENEVCVEAVRAFESRVDDRRRPGVGHWQGEFWGKWMLGAVAACRWTGSDELRQRIRWMVNRLLATQDADGYVGTYSDSTFGQTGDRVFEWNVWCRKYTLWGLLEAYELLHDERILAAAERMADHLAGQVGPGKFDIVQTGWHHGLPSSSLLVPMVHLYHHTKRRAYLEYAQWIVDRWARQEGPPDILRMGLSGQAVADWFPDRQPWVKTYEFLSCCEGMLELYRVTGEADLLRATESIFDSIRSTDRHLTGGLGSNDHVCNGAFLLQTPMEICDAVHWARLATHLLRLTGRAEYAREIERVLYNILLGGAGREGFWGLRRHLLAGSHWVAPQHCGLKTHHCCVANLPRGLFLAIQTAVMRDDEGPVIQLYLPGTYRLDLADGPAVLRIETEYPAKEDVRVHVIEMPSKPQVLRLRVPEGSGDMFVDGRPAVVRDGYCEVGGPLAPGRVIHVRLSLAARLIPPRLVRVIRLSLTTR